MKIVKTKIENMSFDEAVAAFKMAEKEHARLLSELDKALPLPTKERLDRHLKLFEQLDALDEIMILLSKKIVGE